MAVATTETVKSGNSIIRAEWNDEISSFFSENTQERLTDAKKKNVALAHSLKRLNSDDKLVNRVFMCANNVIHIHSAENKKTHIEGYFCDHRLCPVCNWYKSRSLFSRVYRYVRSHPDRTYVFVTLTVPNVKADELRETVLKMNRAFGKLFNLRNKESKASKYFTGYIRRVEVTYNTRSYSKSYRTFHPHIHALLECKPEYAPNTECFYHKDELLKDWQYYMGDDRIDKRAIDIEQVYGEKNDSNSYSEDLAKCCAEVCKYPFKYAKKLFLPENTYLLDEFVSAISTLKGLRFDACSQNFRDILHFVSKDEPNDNEVDITDCTKSPDSTGVRLVWLGGHIGAYALVPFKLNQIDKLGFNPLERFRADIDFDSGGRLRCRSKPKI